MAYSGVYVFGDSLVDSGNALKLANFYGSLPFTALPDGAPTADKGYFQGRFSNGYVFTDLISNKAIGLVSKPVFPFGYDDPWLGVPLNPFAGDPSGNNLNFAYGGSHVIKGDEAVSDLDEQTDAARDAFDGDYPRDGLYLVTTGGNDVRDLAPARSDPVTQAEAYHQLDLVAEEMLDEIMQMIVDGGAQNIVITGIPDCGSIPDYDRNGNNVLDGAEVARSAAATEYSLYLDNLIRTQVVPALKQQLADLGIDPNKIVYVPVMDHVNGSGQTVTGALNLNLPTLAYLHNVTPPPDYAGTPGEYLASHLLEYGDLVFFDHVHPNAQAHALLASYMQSLISGTSWVETMPLLGSGVDYRTVGTIGAAGEVDGIVVSMIAGTTYTFQMLGVSTVTPYVLDQLDIASLGSGMVLADPSLRLVSSTGTVLQSDDDSGAGLDASLSFNAVTAGSYTLHASAVGMLTGNYVLTATVTGAAMQRGDTYTVSSPSTLVLEGAGGAGTDTVNAGVSYALAAGSEIEVLQTTNARGKTAINLTGNEFNQTIVGNGGANVIEGKGGSDTMTGGGGNDRFVLSNAAVTNPGAANVDRIMDYSKGDVVDVTQILSVAGGTNVASQGYLRVTTNGLVQVDVNGGGNEWVTLSTINGNGAVTARYLSGGVATNVSLTRVNDPLATITSTVLTGAVAAAGLMSMPLAAEPSPAEDLVSQSSTQVVSRVELAETVAGPEGSLALERAGTGNGETGEARASSPAAMKTSTDAHDQAAPAVIGEEMSQLPSGADVPVRADAGSVSLAAHAVAMPSAEALLAVADAANGEAKDTAEVGRVLADALEGGSGQGPSIDALLASATPAGTSAVQALATHFADATGGASFAQPHMLMIDMLSVHHDAALAA